MCVKDRQRVTGGSRLLNIHVNQPALWRFSQELRDKFNNFLHILSGCRAHQLCVWTSTTYHEDQLIRTAAMKWLPT